MKTGCFGRIYLVTNTVNGKVYVGQTTKTLKKRWSGHKASSRRLSQTPLHRAIRKYGLEVFTITELGRYPNREALDQGETQWVKFHNSTTSGVGYNCTDGGETGYDRTPEYKSRLSRVQKERMSSQTARKQISEAQKNRFSDPAIRKEVSKSQKRYLENHPDELLRLRAQSQQYNESAEGRSRHSEILRAAWAHPDSRARYAEGQAKRFQTPEGREHILRVGAKGRAARWSQYRALRGEWAPESAVRDFIQGLTVKTYEAKRKGQPSMPKQSYFPRVYGKTFQEVRDGQRRKAPHACSGHSV